MDWGCNEPNIMAYFRARPGGRRSGSMCSEGCGNKAVVRGFCQAHYNKKRRALPKTMPCSIAECTRFAISKGLCSAHYNHSRTYGSPTASKPLYKKSRRNFSGIKFGKITVISSNDDGTWNCECDCGNKNIIKTHHKVGDAINRGSESYCSMCFGPGNLTSILDKILRDVTKSYKSGALNRGLDFNLTSDEIKFIIFSPCLYCGFEKDKEHKGQFYCGIDRVDNNLGYTIANSVACCTTCNFAKRNLTQASWESWLGRIVHFRNSKIV